MKYSEYILLFRYFYTYIFFQLLFFAVKRGPLPDTGGGGDNGHLPSALAIVTFTVVTFILSLYITVYLT